jgi:hypothetical protein
VSPADRDGVGDQRLGTASGRAEGEIPVSYEARILLSLSVWAVDRDHGSKRQETVISALARASSRRWRIEATVQKRGTGAPR